MAGSLQDHHEKRPKMMSSSPSIQNPSPLIYSSFTFDYNSMTLSKKKSSSGPEWQGQELKLHVVFEKEGDTNWPISVKVMIKQNYEKEICLSQIIWRLREQNLNDYLDSSVSYYHQARKIYIFGFIIPADFREADLLAQEKYKKKIHESAFSYTNSQLYLKLRFRKKVGSRLELLKEEQKLKYNDYENQNRQTKQKEKTISEVVEKVALWRKLYTGFIDEKNEVVHMDLDTSATEIGIVKKTLDDYLLQIRNGKRYGFNFHKRRSDKIGELRTFVKERKNNDEKNKK